MMKCFSAHNNNCAHLCFRLKNSNQLENSIQNGKNFLSTIENRLAREEVAPADMSSLEKTQRELAVRWLWQSLQSCPKLTEKRGIIVNVTLYFG